MSEFNLYLLIESDDSKIIGTLKTKFNQTRPYPNIVIPQLIKSTRHRLYLCWDVGVAQVRDEDDYDIAVLVNNIFQDGIKEVYGLYFHEHDESGIGDYIYIGSHSIIDPYAFELWNAVIYSGENSGNALFQDKGIDLDNAVDAIDCIVLEHKNGLLSSVVDIERFAGYTDEDALASAIEEGLFDKVKLLIDNGSDVNRKDVNCFGQTPLMLASDKKDECVMKLLIKNGADIHACDDDGETALICAARSGCKEIVVFLLKNGARVNACSNDGVTPLIAAAENGHADIVTLLIEHKADIFLKGPKGRTALLSAASEIKGMLMVSPDHIQIVIQLINSGADIMEKDKYGLGLMHFAVLSNDLSFLRFLIEQGADINPNDGSGNTPLGFAREENLKDVVDFLKLKGVS